MADGILCASGIYAIRNTVNNKVYIGSSKNVFRRLREHKSSLVRGRHHSIKLSNAWAKYGSEAFVFELLVRIPEISQLAAHEQRIIDSSNACGVGGYNVRPDATSNQGLKLSAERIRQMSERLLGTTRSPEDRAKISAGQKGRVMSAETRAKLSAAKKGIPRSDEHCLALSVANKGKTRSAETRARMSEGQKKKNRAPGFVHHNVGRKHSPEHLQKIRDAKLMQQQLRQQSI